MKWDTRWLPNDVWGFDNPNTTRTPRLRLLSPWRMDPEDGLWQGSYQVRESQITGSPHTQLELWRPESDQAIVRIGPQNDWPDTDSDSYPKEATLTYYCSRKRWYDCFVDVSLNRLADPDVPKFVTFLRGDAMRTPMWQVQSKTDSGPYVTHGEMDPADGIWKLGNYAGISPEGGFMRKFLHNITTPVKGQVVRASTSGNDTVSLINIDGVDPFGVVYDGIPDSNGRIWVVVAGVADVLYINTAGVSRRQFARALVSADSAGTPVAGSAVGETAPTPPLATDKHFQEIGHILQTTTGPGLALTALHFN